MKKVNSFFSLVAVLSIFGLLAAGCLAQKQLDQAVLQDDQPAIGMPVPGLEETVEDTEVNSFMPVPGSDVPEMIVE